MHIIVGQITDVFDDAEICNRLITMNLSIVPELSRYNIHQYYVILQSTAAH